MQPQGIIKNNMFILGLGGLHRKREAQKAENFDPTIESKMTWKLIGGPISRRAIQEG